MKTENDFRRLGTMLDCSRNAVMTVKSVKRWIDITSDLGYNTLLLYTEDTYEVDNNPYFGYMRGGYSQKELKEINDYAHNKGMELIPCIQTLAHLWAIMRWPAYQPINDTEDIMLVGDERVYELIDNMFCSIEKCFTSRIVNIGMDEAHMIGRGSYMDQNGSREAAELFLEHLQRVSEIAKRHGFRIIMWSDMFFRMVNNGDYCHGTNLISRDVMERVPKNVELVYWDYYTLDKSRYDRMNASHNKIHPNHWFAGGLWTWPGFAPHNGFSMNATLQAFKSCREHGVQDVFLAMWGDGGAECSKFALLPALFYASEVAKGNTNKASIKEKFKQKFGISFDRFMLLDLPGTPGGMSKRISNAERYLFYNDCFTGLLDSTLSGGENEQYAACAKKLRYIKKEETWGYLFEKAQALCEVLAIKAELGVKTREIYHSRNREELLLLIRDYKTLYKRIEKFHRIFQKQWFLENKPHGFDVQDIRIGGLMMRVKSCTERLQQLYNGEIELIEELEEKQLDFRGGGDEFGHKHTPCYEPWSGTVTVNNICS